MRSQCRSERGGRAVTRRSTRIARIEASGIAALILTLGAASGCTRNHAAEPLKRAAVTPVDATDPSTWFARSPGKKLPSGTVDPGPTHEQPGEDTADKPTTPVNPTTPDSGVPSNPVDAGPSDPVVTDPPVEEEPPAIVPTATLIFNESASSEGTSPAPQSFSVRSVRELFIHTVWSHLIGEHTETRKFYSPSGELYYEKLTPFSTDIEAPLPFEKPVNIPHATSIQAAPLDDNGNVIVSDYIGVAGTWISDRSMTGIWTVEIYLDDAAKPSVRTDLELVP